MEADIEELTRKRDELLEPKWFVSKLSAERVNLGGLRIFQIIVSRHNRDGRVGETGDRSESAKHLEPARERHTQVEDDRVRFVRLCERQAFVRRERGPNLITLQPEHP